MASSKTPPAPARPGGAGGDGHTHAGLAPRCGGGPCLSVSSPFVAYIPGSGGRSNRENLAFPGATWRPRAAWAAFRTRARAAQMPRGEAVRAATSFDPVDGFWMPPGCRAWWGGGPFKPRSLILTRVVRRKGGAHQHLRKRRLRALPRFAKVTLLTGGPAPVAPEAMLASHVAPAGASRTQSACWSLGAGLPPAQPRTGRGSGGRSVSSDGKGRSWNVDLPGSLLAATFCDFALH